MSDGLDVEEFISGFLAEAEEHLTLARTALATIDHDLQRGGRSPKPVRELFRALHTLKGLSSMVGAEPIVDIAHELETLLRSADRAGGLLPQRALDHVLAGLGAIEERVRALGRGEPLAPAPKQLIETLAALQFDAAPAGPTAQLELEPELLAKLSLAEQEQLVQGLNQGQRAARVDFMPSLARAADNVTITTVRQNVGALGEIVKVLPRTVSSPDGAPGGIAFTLLVLTRATTAALAEAAYTSPEQVGHIGLQPTQELEPLPTFDDLSAQLDPVNRDIVRVEVSRLDRALEGLSALVVTRGRLERAVAQLSELHGPQRALSDLVAQAGRQLKELRAAIMSARMVPVAELLDRAPLIVRGLSRGSNKLVQLTIDAGHSELDKSVADRLFPAIIHLLRNAVDHAIEPPQERLAVGKPEQGEIRVRCFNRSASQLSLEISDDGRGIDRARVAQRAGTALPSTDADLLALITRPGLSTLDNATHVSGRGLGMDIVKRIVVDELGGELLLHTEAGRGSRFTVVVPLSITILDVLSFKSGEKTYVVPVSSVEDLADVEPSLLSRAPQPHSGPSEVRLFKHRGATVPLFHLSALLGAEPAGQARAKAIIVRRANQRFAFEIDQMMGKHEVVVRPLRDPLVRVKGVSGSTDLGDGSPTLVLDLLSLLQPGHAAQEGLAV